MIFAFDREIHSLIEVPCLYCIIALLVLLYYTTGERKQKNEMYPRFASRI